MEHKIYLNHNKPRTTLQTALDAAAAYRKKAPDTPIIIEIAGGRYPILSHLAIPISNLTLRAAAGQDVVLTGAMPLQHPNWQPCPTNPAIYCTQLAPNLAIDGFFVDDAPQILARYPNFDAQTLPLGGVVDAATLKARRSNWADPTTGYLRALHSSGWGGNDYHITGIDDTAETGLALSWVGDNNRGDALMPSSVMVEGILEELDAPHEWFYCAKSGMLYYMPPAEIDLCAAVDPDSCAETASCDAIANPTTTAKGSNTPAHHFEVALCGELFTVQGESVENPITNVTFEHLTIQNTKRTLFDAKHSGKGYTPLLRGDWAVVRTGAIFAQNASNLTIRHCNFNNIGGNALFLYGYHAGHQITHNRFCQIGATAIQVVGNPTAVDDPSFWPHAHYPDLQIHATTVAHPAQVGPVSEDYPRELTIAENYLYDLGVYEKQSCGVNLSVASRIRILHNTMHKSARANINVNDGSFGGHEIAYNDIFDAQRETTDHGPFNAWGRDRFWSVPSYNAIGQGGEVIRHYPHTDGNRYDTALLDAYQTTTIHDNRFHHSKDAPHTWGIDLDDGSSNYAIYNNLCLGLGIKLREGFARKVYNNIILDGKLEIHVPYAEAGDEIHHNLIVNHQPWNFIAVDNARFAAAQYQIDHNWYFNFGQPIALPEWAEANALCGDDPCFANLVTEGAINPASSTSKISSPPTDNAHAATSGNHQTSSTPAANNYTPTNTAAMAQVGFVPFATAQFGAAIAPVQAPHYPLCAKAATETPRYLWLRACICDITEAIISATASADTQGCYIIKTAPAAAALGVRTHDIIKAANGETVCDALDFLAKMNHCHNAPTSLTVFREGAMQILTLKP